MWLLPAWRAKRLRQSAQAPSEFFPDPAPVGASVAETSRQNAILASPNGTYPQGYNFALLNHGAKATGGTHPEALIDGDFTDYSGGTGFATTTWGAKPAQFFLVTLRFPVTIDCVRLLLWDRDEDRYYRYKLEICADDKGETWLLAADHTGPAEQCRSWQVVRFKPQPVKLIRLTGTYNSSNSGFHVVELQASLGLPPGTPPPRPAELLEF